MPRFSDQATPANFCNAYDARAHLERAFDPRLRTKQASFSIAARFTSRHESDTDATQAPRGAGRERVSKVLPRQGPSSWHLPSTRVAGLA